MIKRTINGIEWTGMNIGGTVSLSASMPIAAAEALRPALALAADLGITSDVFAGFSEPGETEVTVQFPANRVDTLAALVRLLQEAA